MEWRSNARLKQELAEGTIFSIKGQADICIHKIHGLGDKFYLTCGQLNFCSFGLNTDDFNTAVNNAKKVVKVRMERLNAVYTNFIEDESNNVIVRY